MKNSYRGQEINEGGGMGHNGMQGQMRMPKKILV
jgi:hypothetical protein